MHAAQMADELSAREQALRRLPLPYSLALRPSDAGVAAEVICQYVNVERAAWTAATASPKRNSLRRKGQHTAATTSATDAADHTTLRSRGQQYRHHHRFNCGRRGTL
jgi:hypothetical protein